MRGNVKTCILLFVFLVSLIPTNFTLGLYGTKFADGNLNEWGTLDLIATNDYPGGGPGADLKDLYVAWDDEYLYIAIKTDNTQSWNLAYGFAIDVDPGTTNGYDGTTDAWGRHIAFNGYYPDYEVYFWWDGGSGITADNFIAWTGSGWDYKSLGDVGASFSYTGDTSNGLQILEIKIPWSALGGKPNKIALISWIAGGDDSSAVDSLPEDQTLHEVVNERYGSGEWNDDDTFSNLAEIIIAPKTIDGNLSDWASYEVVGVSNLSIQAGADLDKLYVSYDDQYLYIALETNNTQSWDVAYGIGIDVTDGGYTGNQDSWGRKIGFSRGVDYEVYFWWSGGSKAITSANFNRYNGYIGNNYWESWDYNFASFEYAYTGGNNGLQTLEIRIPWDALGGKASEMAIMAWVAGGDGSSAVDVTPADADIDGNDWVDQDYLSNFAVLSIPIPKPELAVKLEASKLEIERYETTNLTITVENYGIIDAKNVDVQLLVNDEIIKTWTVNVTAKGSEVLTYEWKPSATGTYEFKAIVDPDNLIEEANEDNNVATVTVEVGKIEIAQRNFVNLATYVWPKLYEKKYAETLALLKSISEAKLPLKYQENLTRFYEQLNLSKEKFGKGEALIGEAHSQFSGATKIFSAYSSLIRLQREINAFMQAVEGELLATKLTKAIDGDLSDWSPETLVYEDTTGFGQDGANLKALYVDYDDSFLYIALTTENKASWRIAYGIALDTKEGGYTTGADAWGRRLSFSRGIDYELYFWWFGEFFGEKGTDSIETMQLTVWNGEGWEYYNLADIGFATWTGKEKGLQTLEIAVPWDMLGGKPSKIAIVAWITGASAGDSAVETLPDNPSIHDVDVGQEWTDEDTITVFAEVEIS
jgi:subtilase family serine protease